MDDTLTGEGTYKMGNYQMCTGVHKVYCMRVLILVQCGDVGGGEIGRGGLEGQGVDIEPYNVRKEGLTFDSS